MSDREGELIQQYSNLIRNGTGQEYTVQSWARETAGGEWVGWLEFHPLDDQIPVRATPAVISRPGRLGLTQWAAQLSDDYLEDAFGRAK